MSKERKMGADKIEWKVGMESNVILNRKLEA